MAEEDNLLRVARPTINVAGEDDPRLASGLLKLAISENTQGLFRCEATFGNWDVSDNPTGFLYFDRRKLDFGKAFKIKLGAESLFDGRIMGLEASFPEGRPPEITVLAEDRFQDLRMTRRTRTFTDVSDADVMSQIANEHGLSPAMSVQGPTYKVLAQVNQSDLAFLRERARSVDAELWMDGNKLQRKAARQPQRQCTRDDTRQGAARIHSPRRPCQSAHQRLASTAGTSPANPRCSTRLPIRSSAASSTAIPAARAFSAAHWRDARKRSRTPCRSPPRKRRRSLSLFSE